jgi:hypothetical protein
VRVIRLLSCYRLIVCACLSFYFACSEFENYDQFANNGTGPESLHAFVDACRGQPFYNGADGTVGLRVVQTLDAMYRSAKSGRPERVK